MLWPLALLLIFAAVIVAIAVDRHDHPKPIPFVPPPHYHPLQPPTRFGMKGEPGTFITPKDHSDYLSSSLVGPTQCDAQIKAYLDKGVAVGGANYGYPGGPPLCQIFKPMHADEYIRSDDAYTIAYLGQAAVPAGY